MLTSCVTKKKYAALESELTKLKALETAVTSINNEVRQSKEMNDEERDPEIEDLRKQLKLSRIELDRVNGRLGILDQGDLSPEQFAILQQQEMRLQEKQMMENQRQTSQSDELIATDYRKLRNAKTAAEAIYTDDSKVTVTQTDLGLVISAPNDHLFGSDMSSVSASGETFLERLTGILEVSKGLTFSIIGISKETSQKSDAAKRAIELDKKLLDNSTYKSMGATVGAADCDHSFSELKSKCDRVEFVLQPAMKEPMRLKQIGQ